MAYHQPPIKFQTDTLGLFAVKHLGSGLSPFPRRDA